MGLTAVVLDARSTTQRRRYGNGPMEQMCKGFQNSADGRAMRADGRDASGREGGRRDALNEEDFRIE
jgi:hypothetical protein